MRLRVEGVRSVHKKERAGRQLQLQMSHEGGEWTAGDGNGKRNEKRRGKKRGKGWEGGHGECCKSFGRERRERERVSGEGREGGRGGRHGWRR